MGLEAVKDMLPDYARDVKLNLSGLVNASPLSEQQLWGAVAAVAAASAPSPAVAHLDAEAKQRLSAEAYSAAHGAAAIMAMNNVYYRAKHLLADMGVTSYANVPARLRMQVIGTHGGAPKEDFELWCFAVSAVNGCGMCVNAHDAVLKKHGVGREAVQSAVRVAAVVHAVAQVLAFERAA